jgi:indolepyruvate ferredoxin oxidoreductase beta subunit
MANEQTGNLGFNLVIAGVGGQGVVVLSNAIGSACREAGMNVITGELHGLSQRSGTVYIHTRIGGNAISPLIPYGEADAIVSLEAMEALRYIEYLKDGGIVIMNTWVIPPPVEVSDLTKNKSGHFVKLGDILKKLKVVTSSIFQIDALRYAKKAGSTKTENAVFIGALASLAALPVSIKEMKKGLERVVPQKALAQNLKAFELGRKAAFEGLCHLVPCR